MTKLQVNGSFIEELSKYKQVPPLFTNKHV